MSGKIWNDMKKHFCDAADFVGRQAGRVYSDAPRIVDEQTEPICGDYTEFMVTGYSEAGKSDSVEDLIEQLQMKKEIY